MAHQSLVFEGMAEEDGCFFLVETNSKLSPEALAKLETLLPAKLLPGGEAVGPFIGPRKELVTPYSTNATEIMHNVGVGAVTRIERFEKGSEHFDPMVQDVYESLDATSLTIDREPAPTRSISDIRGYAKQAGLALSEEEVVFLEAQSKQLGRLFTDAELYGFAQVNSEHCRHKVFNGTFVVDGVEQPESLFSLIKRTSKAAGNELVSAYRDNVAFIKGPSAYQFAPKTQERPDTFQLEEIPTVLSLKAETHNFPTTVEPFNGASTGSGGEIRDRMAGGIGSIPLAGTAAYMTSYPRLQSNAEAPWQSRVEARPWQYQSPAEILIKASNGASDFGNKFGQPLINGSVLTFEAQTSRALYAFDKCIMLGGGVGFAHADHAQKRSAKAGDAIVLLGGDNYRIGMGGGSVSSVKSGEYGRAIELSAVQRANAEMQKRVFNVLRALCEIHDNPVALVHDHGAGGHINCLSELVEGQGGVIHLDALPIGDATLSSLEVICNESQERMGLVVPQEHVDKLKRIAERERAPLYIIGRIDGSQRIRFERSSDDAPVNLPLETLLGSSPKLVLHGSSVPLDTKPLPFSPRTGADLKSLLCQLLSLEAVGCKDWLTNKVDRSVTGKIAQQQCVGPLHLPLANLGVVVLDYTAEHGIGTALGHAPGAAILDERAGSVLSIAESLTNLIWAPLTNGLSGVALSANWMWPCKRPGEDARLYRAVAALSEAAQALGIPVPTGKDSVSMTMTYDNGLEVRSPGTVIVSAVSSVSSVSQMVTPDLKQISNTKLLYVNLSGVATNPLGGSSLAQIVDAVGDETPTVIDLKRFKQGLETIQQLIRHGAILAGHDVSSGGLIGCVCEMAFAGDMGISLDVSRLPETQQAAFLFCEKPGVVLQLRSTDFARVAAEFKEVGLEILELGSPVQSRTFSLEAGPLSFSADLRELRRAWYKPSALLNDLQTKNEKARERAENYERFPLSYALPQSFTGRAGDYGVDLRRYGSSGIVAAIIREKGTNGDREMAFAMHAAGFDVRDVTMYDLMVGSEDLKGVNFVVFPGGFSNSDVLGAGRGWGAAFQHNERAMRSLGDFMARRDTLSLGVCNGCQLMVALNLLYPEHAQPMKMRHNESGKFESHFVAVRIEESRSVLLQGLAGSVLGVWVAHGEGRFHLPQGEKAYAIPIKYLSSSYPTCPNGADFMAAGVCSADGRHLAMMPHPERSVLPWQWPFRDNSCGAMSEITPWMMIFSNARAWIASRAVKPDSGEHSANSSLKC